MRSPCAAVLLAALLALWTTEVCAASPTAHYELTFDATWSETTHPGDFPPNPHFSGLIGGTHAATAAFWQPGGLASAGIERMAEQGQQQTLGSEIDQAVDEGTAELVIFGGGIGSSPGSVRVQFTVSRSFPQLTLVSMLAPSPDWFVGVEGLTLLDGSQWTQNLVIPLFVYDAGTDSGPSFLSADDDTDPQEPIIQIATGPLANGVPVGTFTITRLDADPIPVLSRYPLYFLAFLVLVTSILSRPHVAYSVRPRRPL
jgi:hypothetical protein